MAVVDVKVGSFTLNTATGNQSITGLGFQPKLVIFWVNQIVSVDPGSGSANEIRSCRGAASSSTARFTVSRSYLGGSYGHSSSRFTSDRCLRWDDSSTDTAQMGADFVSMNADGFTINVTNGEANVVVKYMAIGGTGVSAKVGFTDIPTGTAFNHAITGAGFAPKVAMVMSGPYNITDTAEGVASTTHGFATSSTNDVCMAHNSYFDGLSQSFSLLNSTRRFLQTINQDGNFESTSEFGSMDADGITIAVSDGPPTTMRVGYILLGGAAKYDLRVLTQRTTVGQQSVTGLDFTPAGLLLASITSPSLASNVAASDIKWAMGAAGAGPSEVSDAWYLPNDSSSAAVPTSTASSAKVLATPGTTNGATLSEADLLSFNQDGYTLDWTKVDGVASEIIALAMGNTEPVQFNGNVQGSTTVTGALTTGIRLAGNAAVQSTVSADLYIEINFVGHSQVSTTLTADLTIDPVLRGASVSNTTVTGDITTGIALAENLISTVTLTADLSIFPYQPESHIESATTVVANLSTGIALESRLSCPLLMTADLTTIKPIAADISGRVTLLGNLTAPSDVVGMLDFNDWLESDTAVRCILVETSPLINDVATNLYMSNRHYVTKAFDAPAHTAYEAVLTGGIQVTEMLGLDSTQTISFGDVEIRNLDGSLDHWLDYVWKNRSIRVYIGDPMWMRSKFQLIFDGVISDIGSSGREKLNIKLRDKLERLNNPVHEAKVGGTSPEKDRLLPLAFGEVHNVTPLLVDPANHVYQLHNGPIESITEVRDNGMPINVLSMLEQGKFSLTSSPAGTITCSLQGDKPATYYNDVVSLIKRLVTAYGKESDRFIDNEIDHPSFDTFQAVNSQAIGTFLSDRANVLQVCQEAAKSVGAQLCVSRIGKLQIKRIDLDFTTIESGIFEIHPYHMYAQKIAIVSRTEVVAADKIGFAKNWTVQSDLQTAVIEEHKSLYAQEWLTETVKINEVATTYNLDTEPQQRDTMLISRSDAFDECTRRLDILSVPRHTFRFEGVPLLINLTLGQRVKLFHTRYGLQSGKYGVVVRLSPDWMTGRVNVDVMV